MALTGAGGLKNEPSRGPERSGSAERFVQNFETASVHFLDPFFPGTQKRDSALHHNSYYFLEERGPSFGSQDPISADLHIQPQGRYTHSHYAGSLPVPL